MRYKHPVIALVSTSLVFGVAGCSGSTVSQSKAPQSGTKDNAKQQEKVELRISWWGGEPRAKMYNQIIDNFEKKYPHIKVSREFADFGPYWDKLSTQMAGGNAPDIVHMHQTKLADYAKRNQLLALDDLVKSKEIDLTDFSPAVVDSGKVNGKQYAVSLGYSVDTVYYNADLFKRSGVTPPAENWTWDDFIKKAIELKKAVNRDDFWAIEDGSGSESFLGYILRYKDKDLYTESGKLGYTREDMIEYFKNWDVLRKAGAIPPAAKQAEAGGKEHDQSMFIKGNTGMRGVPANQLKIYQALTKDRIEIARVPLIPGGKTNDTLGGAWMSISVKSKHPKEAALFIHYFVNDQEAGKVFKTEHGPVGSQKMNEFVKPLLNQEEVKVIEFVGKISNQVKLAVTPPLGVAEVSREFKVASEEVAFGKKSIEQAVNDFFAKVDKILK
ncbi:ABC transporter substrate-binding protein [Paenibacillus piri]|uniref:Sugar ABC transporter substrate-binding protein n=1 Tax=Paenibacillus piri TaxID=2547395 RepID=A0A4R5KUB1_9BACL|nr:sugar ABC transporter substrate-binding protein [Paenibacillus piri]TDF99513.1 sugar ABC transporter substrate-binding protein [Paenibacillus piri]